MKITNELVKKIEHLLSFGLTKGMGYPKKGEMCIEACICYALGEPHSDKPSCVTEEITKCKIALNDCIWSSNKARAKGLLKVGIAQLGSKDVISNKEFILTFKLNSTKRIIPFLIQKHYDHLETKDDKLLEYKTKFENLSALDDKLCEEFYNNYNYYNYYSYYYSYYYNHYNYNCYYNFYNYSKLGDEFLLLVADIILETLKQLKSPGCEFI